VKIRWSELAADRLNDIFEYIAMDNDDAATSMVQRIYAGIDRIAQMPYSGRKGQTDGTRELVVPGTPYIVVYEILDEVIYLVTILHGAQNWR
jgi:toxin ParE1/3/4